MGLSVSVLWRISFFRGLLHFHNKVMWENMEVYNVSALTQMEHAAAVLV